MKSLNRTLLILGLIVATRALAEEHPDRVRHEGVPQGSITAGEFADSEVFPGTTRGYSVYVPAQYSPDRPANLMVFMDGAGYLRPDGAFRVPSCWTT